MGKNSIRLGIRSVWERERPVLVFYFKIQIRVLEKLGHGGGSVKGRLSFRRMWEPVFKISSSLNRQHAAVPFPLSLDLLNETAALRLGLSVRIKSYQTSFLQACRHSPGDCATRASNPTASLVLELSKTFQEDERLEDYCP